MAKKALPLCSMKDVAYRHIWSAARWADHNDGDNYKNRMELMASTLGSRMKAARIKAGLTQTQLATKVGASSHTIICDYERGKRGNRRPDIQFLLKVATALNISVDWLFIGENTKPSISKTSS